MCFSGANLVVWVFTASPWQWDLMLFLDAFSRVAGMNLLVIVGFSVVTRGFRPSLAFDAAAFGLIALAAAFVLYVDFMDPLRPWVFLAVSVAFLPFLVQTTRSLYALGEVATARHMVVATTLLACIHGIDDLYELPGEETNVVFNFGFLALMTWSYAYGVLFHAYEALERASLEGAGDGSPPAEGGAALLTPRTTRVT